MGFSPFRTNNHFLNKQNVKDLPKRCCEISKVTGGQNAYAEFVALLWGNYRKCNMQYLELTFFFFEAYH